MKKKLNNFNETSLTTFVGGGIFVSYILCYVLYFAMPLSAK
jgi:hypothetical protein